MTTTPIGTIQPGMIVLWSNADPHMFDSTGLGLIDTPVSGWAICNGQNSTVMLCNMFPLPTDLSADTPTPLEPIGNENHAITLVTDQMPAHSHDVADPGHTHINDKESFCLRDTNVSSSGSGTDIYARNGTSNEHTVAKCNTTGITIAETGGGAPVSILPRSLPILYLQFIGTPAT